MKNGISCITGKEDCDEFDKPEYNAWLMYPERYQSSDKYHIVTNKAFLSSQISDTDSMINIVHLMGPTYERLSDELQQHILNMMELNPDKAF